MAELIASIAILAGVVAGAVLWSRHAGRRADAREGSTT
jgi:hypothetical protein